MWRATGISKAWGRDRVRYYWVEKDTSFFIRSKYRDKEVINKYREITRESESVAS